MKSSSSQSYRLVECTHTSLYTYVFCDGQYGRSVTPRLCVPTGSEPTKSPDDTLYCCAPRARDGPTSRRDGKCDPHASDRIVVGVGDANDGRRAKRRIDGRGLIVPTTDRDCRGSSGGQCHNCTRARETR